MKGIKKVPRRWLSVGLTLSLLAIVCLVGKAVAQEPDGEAPLIPAGGSPVSTMAYQGYLQDNGQPANGVYDFMVDVWDAATGGNQLGSTQVYDSPGVTVENGIFMFYFTPGNAQQVFTGGGRWLRLQVRPHAVGSYTTLPRQPITNVPYAWSLQPGAIISGTTGTTSGYGNAILNLDNTRPLPGGGDSSTLYSRASTGSAVRAESGGVGVYGSSTWTYAIRGEATNGTAGYFTTNEGYGVWAVTNGTDHWDHGGYFSANMGYGVYGVSAQNYGVRGKGYFGVRGDGTSIGVNGSSTDGSGVYGVSSSDSGYGGYFNNTAEDGIALYAQANGSGRNNATLRVDNWESSGGMAAYLINSSNYHTAHFRNASSGGVLYLENGGTDAAGTGGGDFITAVNAPENDAQFRVLTSGEVRSDVGFGTPAADFAEMLPAVEGLEPGDVLVISADGKLQRSTAPYQGNVVGIHSTQPGFLGGQPVEGELEEHVPLAVMGVVPVKASAENGPIVPGDLLTTSSTPGHAMKADHFVGGTIIGKALEGLGEGIGVIQMLVMLQ